MGFAKEVWTESHHDGEGSPAFRGASFVVLFQDPTFEQLGPVQAPRDPDCNYWSPNWPTNDLQTRNDLNNFTA